MACRQDAHSIKHIANAAEEFLGLEREAKEAREHTRLKEVVIQTLEEDKNHGIEGVVPCTITIKIKFTLLFGSSLPRT